MLKATGTRPVTQNVIPYDVANERIARAMMLNTQFRRGDLPNARPLLTSTQIAVQGVRGAYVEKGVLICRLDEFFVRGDKVAGPFKVGLPRVYVTAEDAETFARFMTAFVVSREKGKDAIDEARKILMPGFVHILQHQDDFNIPPIASIFQPDICGLDSFINIESKFLAGADRPNGIHDGAKVFLGFKQGYASFGGCDGRNAIETWQSPIHSLWADLYNFHHRDWYFGI
ncbi:MAG: hypothetical protein NTZ10_02650 [Candidatus Saganbacteria bacterium]|nr:hypothetical protein [Candidatus Saganbacteria bacterium]